MHISITRKFGLQKSVSDRILCSEMKNLLINLLKKIQLYESYYGFIHICLEPIYIAQLDSIYSFYMSVIHLVYRATKKSIKQI